MKSKLKKLLSVFLCALVCIACSAPAYAGSTDAAKDNSQLASNSASSSASDDTSTVQSGTIGDLTWTFDENNCLTISGEGYMPDLGFYAMEAPWTDSNLCENIEKIVIEDGVKSIIPAAFISCSQLKTVTIADSVEYIGKYAFAGCQYLSEITLSNSMTRIDTELFAGCIALKEIVIPDSVTSIGEAAFASCYNLEEITIPDSVTTIEDEAFEFCYNLEEITIPDSVTSIGSRIFRAEEGKTIGTKLIRCNPDSAARTYATENGFDYECITHTFNHDYSIEKEATCTTDGRMKGVCDYCKFDGFVTIPATGHTWSEDYTVTEEPSCTEAGSQSQYCTVCGAVNQDSAEPISAKGHSWSDTQTIDKEATPFEEGEKSIHCTACDERTDITAIPKTSKNSGTVGKLTWTVYANGTLEIEGEGEIPDYSFKSDVTTAPWGTCYKYISNINIGDGITAIGDCAFYGMYVTKITVGNGVAKIGENAFGWCRSLVDITLPDNVKEIDNRAFNMAPVSELVIRCNSGSAAQTYAAARQIKWECLTHNLQDPVTEKAATCTTAGEAVAECSACSYEKSTVIPATGHTMKTYTKKAGYLKNGTTYSYCTICKIKKNVKILAGYSKYAVKSLSVKKANKAFTVSWSKASSTNQKTMSGYQIRYSKKSSMASSKYTTAGKTSTGKTIKSLSAKTKYYVQVRNYMKKGGTTYYSKWSSMKTVKTK